MFRCHLCLPNMGKFTKYEYLEKHLAMQHPDDEKEQDQGPELYTKHDTR